MLRHFKEARAAPITQHLVDAGVLTQATGTIGLVPGALLYALVRVLQPEHVVETGVASGLSSAYLLAALAANGKGRLVSIDLPFTEVNGEPAPIVPGTSIDRYQWSPVPPGLTHGWLVPEELRGRWTLHKGDARELLTPTLEALGNIDVFIHDSLHTLEHMLFEFETAWPSITPGGLLVTDDVARKHVDALQQFSRRLELPYAVAGEVGYMRKPSLAR